MTSPETAVRLMQQVPLQSHHAPADTKSVRLTKEKAAQWIVQLTQLATQGAVFSPSVEQLLNRLEDDCWLSRWKREEVNFEFYHSFITELMECRPVHRQIESSKVLEEIIQELSSI